MTEHFGNALPEMLIEPGRFIVGDAGLVSAEVVLVSRRDRNDPVRWVYLDIGRFGGLAETEGEAIKYRITTPHDGERDGPGGDRRPDLRRRGHPVREVQLPPAAGADVAATAWSCCPPAPTSRPTPASASTASRRWRSTTCKARSARRSAGPAVRRRLCDDCASQRFRRLQESSRRIDERWGRAVSRGRLPSQFLDLGSLRLLL